jgi:hypothetical protein
LAHSLVALSIPEYSAAKAHGQKLEIAAIICEVPLAPSRSGKSVDLAGQLLSCLIAGVIETVGGMRERRKAKSQTRSGLALYQMNTT